MNLYVIIYTHRHGVDAWPRFATEEPGVDAIIEELRKNGEWEEREDEGEGFIEVRGPYDDPHEKMLREIAANYDDTGCEGCGVIDEAAYKGARKVLGLE